MEQESTPQDNNELLLVLLALASKSAIDPNAIELFADDGRITNKDMRECKGKWGHHSDNESQSANY